MQISWWSAHISQRSQITCKKKNPPQLKTFLRQEIQFQRVTHQNDADAREDLYKVNNISEKEMIENLIVLLEDSDAEEAIVFPTEDEIFEKLSSLSTMSVNDDQLYQLNEPLAVFWDERWGGLENGMWVFSWMKTKMAHFALII